MIVTRRFAFQCGLVAAMGSVAAALPKRIAGDAETFCGPVCVTDCQGGDSACALQTDGRCPTMTDCGTDGTGTCPTGYVAECV